MYPKKMVKKVFTLQFGHQMPRECMLLEISTGGTNGAMNLEDWDREESMRYLYRILVLENYTNM